MKGYRNYIIALAIVGLILISNKVSAASLAKINVGSRTRRLIVVNNLNYSTNYPLLPVVANEWTTISIRDTVNAIKAKQYGKNLSLAIFALIIAEAAKDRATGNLKGLNNNYAGVQTDSGVWGYSNFIAQTAKIDSGGKPRMFAAFDSFADFLDFLESRTIAKGFDQATNADTWARIYIPKWIGISVTANLLKAKSNIYKTAERLYSA